MAAKKKDGTLELTEEQYDKLIMDLEIFEENFYKALASTERYEIIPTSTEEGKVLSKEQLSLLTEECKRLGLKILYKVDLNSNTVLLINPKTLKTGYITEGIH